LDQVRRRQLPQSHGAKTITQTAEHATARTLACNVTEGAGSYVPEGTLLEVTCQQCGYSGVDQWWFSYGGTQGGILFYNDSGETAPAYGLMAVTGVETVGGVAIPKVGKPSTTFYRRYLVNGAADVADEGTGFAQDSDVVKVLYDTGTPVVGEEWGPKASQWTATENYPATCLVAGIYDSGDKIMLARLSTIDIIIGKLAGALSYGSSATVNVWGGAAGSEAVISSLTVTGNDWLMKSGADDIASGKKVVVQWINGQPYVTEAECP